jgi:CRP-like cAMP-binding protein
MPEDYIIKQGQKANHMFFLAQGQCEVLVRDQFKKEVFVRDLYPGMLFGEVGLIYHTRRTASVKSKD